MNNQLQSTTESLEERIRASLVRSIGENRQLIEHREELDHLLDSDREGSFQDALCLAVNANRRTTNER